MKHQTPTFRTLPYGTVVRHLPGDSYLCVVLTLENEAGVFKRTLLKCAPQFGHRGLVSVDADRRPHRVLGRIGLDGVIDYPRREA